MIGKKKISVTQHSCILVFNTIADLKETEIFGELANPRPGAGTAQEKPYLYQQRSYFCHEGRHSESDQTWIGLHSSTSEGR